MNTETQTTGKEDKKFELLTLPGPGGVATSADGESIRDFRRRMQEFTKIINTPPDPGKIRERTEGRQTYKYLPVSTIEKDLNKVYFGLVQIEILEYKQIFNEMVVTARIKVFHPVICQWMNYDGIGAGLIQQHSETPIDEFFRHKKPSALKLASPIAYAEAIKNGAKKIGKRFGADLNREFEDFYQGYNIPESDPGSKPLND